MSKYNNYFDHVMFVEPRNQTPGHAEQRLVGIADLVLPGLDQCKDVHLRRLIKIIWMYVHLLADNFGNFVSEEVSTYAVGCECTLADMNVALNWLVDNNFLEKFTDADRYCGYHIVKWAKWSAFWDKKHCGTLIPQQEHIQEMLDMGWQAKGDYCGTDAAQIYDLLSGGGKSPAYYNDIEEIRNCWNAIAKKWEKMPDANITKVRLRKKLQGEIEGAIRVAGGKNILLAALNKWGDRIDCLSYTWGELIKDDYALLKELVLFPDDNADTPMTEMDIGMPDILVDKNLPVDTCETRDGRILSFTGMTPEEVILEDVVKRGLTVEEYKNNVK